MDTFKIIATFGFVFLISFAITEWIAIEVFDQIVVYEINPLATSLVWISALVLTILVHAIIMKVIYEIDNDKALDENLNNTAIESRKDESVVVKHKTVSLQDEGENDCHTSTTLPDEDINPIDQKRYDKYVIEFSNALHDYDLGGGRNLIDFIQILQKAFKPLIPDIDEYIIKFVLELRDGKNKYTDYLDADRRGVHKRAVRDAFISEHGLKTKQP